MVKIKLQGSRKEKIKGFYLLITNGHTHSNKEDEFIVEDKLLTILQKEKINFEVL